MQMINSTTPAATTALNQPSASDNNPMSAGSDLIAKMFQNQGGIGGDLMKMLMNPSSLQKLQGDAASDADGVEGIDDENSTASESSAASDEATANGAKDAGAVLEKLMEDLTSLINLLKNQNSDGKQMQQAQGENPAEGSQSASTGTPQANGASEGAQAANKPAMTTRPMEMGAASQGQPTMGSSSSSQSQSNSANGNTTTTNTQDGKTTTSTNNQSNIVRGNNIESANGIPAVMTAGSLNQASLDRESKAVNDSFKGAYMSSKPEAMPTSLDGSTSPLAGTEPANSFNLNGTVNDGKPVGSANLKLGDVNVKASLDDASELSVGADAKLTPSTTATLSGDKGGIDAGVKFDDGNTNVGAKVNNIGGPDTNAQIDAGTKIGDNGFVQGSYNTNGAASFGIGLNF
jgi:hypothetical protein